LREFGDSWPLAPLGQSCTSEISSAPGEVIFDSPIAMSQANLTLRSIQSGYWLSAGSQTTKCPVHAWQVLQARLVHVL
jgi:hypothetical protein